MTLALHFLRALTGRPAGRDTHQSVQRVRKGRMGGRQEDAGAGVERVGHAPSR